jgi:hypothetical protein
MATQKGSYLTSAILSVLRGTAFPAVPANFYLALFTTMPTTSGGTGAVEVSGGSYARVALSPATGTWGAPALQGDNVTEQTTNTNAIAFATATANWGTVLGVGIYDALSGGNLWYYGTLSASIIVNNGTTFSIAAGNLAVHDS